MNIEREKEILRSELGVLSRFIEGCPPEDYITRLSFESRRAEVESELRKLEAIKGRTAHATLLFRGTPVMGALGIEADFGGQVLESFQRLITKAAATRARQAPEGRGLPPTEPSAHLFVTGTAAGSFGFTLEEQAEIPQEGLTPLAEAVDDAGRLLAAAQDDEKFGDALAQTDPEVIRALSKFLGVLKDRGATLHVQAGEVVVDLDDPQQLQAAYQRTATVREETDLHIDCTLEGLLPHSRRFELRRTDTGELVGGRLSRELQDPEALKPFVFQHCVAHLRVVTFQRPGKELRRYELRALTSEETRHDDEG